MGVTGTWLLYCEKLGLNDRQRGRPNFTTHRFVGFYLIECFPINTTDATGMSFPEYRTDLKHLIAEQQELSEAASTETTALGDLREQLASGELSVAVVGEINRGKSTFLNALLGEKVFPSRVMVCTAGVTVLDHGEEPRAEIAYKNGKTEDVLLNGEERPDKILKKVVSRRNDDVQSIRSVRVEYPNPFAGNGIVLVDTPGVNDPEHWREEITYSYLAEADAVIMLLDPMQPLSASETEFLSTKILERSISNLIFVVNKIDDVSQEDRQAALKRVEEQLSEHVPNPRIHAVAAKPALKAKRSGDETALPPTGFPAFEESLLDFLAKGRGGMLLETEIQKALSHLGSIEDSIASRVGALDEEKGQVKERLREAERGLEATAQKREDLRKELRSRKSGVKQNLKQAVEERERYLNGSLKPSLKREGDAEVLRERVLSFQRDTVERFRTATEEAFEELLDEFDASSAELAGEARSVLSDLGREATNRAQDLRVQRRERENVRHSELQKRRQGATAGAAAGAAAGVAMAGSAATTAATIGLGIVTGGIGLLVGAGAAALLSEGSSSGGPQQGESDTYIDSREIVDNAEALKALDRFTERLKSTAGELAEALVAAAEEQVVEPIKEEERRQRQLIAQVERDLEETAEEQADLRRRLGEQEARAEELRGEYEALSAAVSSL